MGCYNDVRGEEYIMAKPVVKTTSFDDNPGGAASYNVEAAEDNAFDYRITARFNEPAEAVVYLRDVDGSLAQKYNDDSRDVYIGPGRLKIENPAAATVFDGRIYRAPHNKDARMLTLYTRDWLSQLDFDKKNKDMREDLDGSGLRQSEAHADADLTDYLVDAAISTLYSAQAYDNNLGGGGPNYDDETDGANELTDDDMTLMPAVPEDDDAYYFGFESKVAGMFLYISQQGDWNGTNEWEYWDGGAWVGLTIGFPTDPKRNFEAAGLQTYTWTVPGDWATVAVNGVTAYYVRAVVDNFTGITTQPLGRICYAEYYLYDDNMAWDATPGNPQNFDGMFLVLTTAMAGKNTWTFHPYKSTVTAGTTYSDDEHNTWIDNDAQDGGFKATDWELDYDFRVYLGNDTPSDFYVHDSITAATIKINYQLVVVAGNHAHLQLDDKTDGFIDLHNLEGETTFHRDALDLTVEQIAVLVDADGIASIRLDLDRTGGNITIAIKYCALEITAETTGYSSAVGITETEANRIRISTDMTLPATRIWERIPYSIVRPIWKHIDSAESPGDLVTDSGGEVSLTGPDPLVALTSAANIEHTSGFSLRRYEERSDFEMLVDLAKIDKTAFWMPIGTVGLIWKSTFNDGAPTAITDTDVISWNGGEYNFDPVFNEMHLYEAKTGGIQTDYNTADAAPDPGADSKVRYGVTKSNVVKNTGTTNRRDIATLGEVLVERDEDVNLFLNADIRGFSALRLGDEVSITSTYLGLTAAKYVITFWEYLYSGDRTTIRLHPRNSTKGFVPHALFGDQIRNRFNDLESDRVADTFLDIPTETTT